MGLPVQGSFTRHHVDTIATMLLYLADAFANLVVKYGSLRLPAPKSGKDASISIVRKSERISNASRRRTKLKQTPVSDLTTRALVYLIRASSLNAQVAQSVEQRTENSRNTHRVTD